MQRRAVVLALIAAIAMAPVASAELLRNLNLSGGESEGHWVIVTAKALKEGAPMGEAIIGIGKGEDLEAAFGMVLKNYKPAVGAVTAEQLAEVRTSDKAPEAQTAIIKVNADQYAKIAEIVKRYSETEEFTDNPTNVAMNYATEVLRAIGGMKMPYRSGLGSSNAINYFNDIGVLNRKKV